MGPTKASVDPVTSVPETLETSGDQRIVIHGVTWDQYETVRTALDDIAGLRMTYLDGILEIMSPGRRHEEVKTLVARLVEIYALEREIDLSGYGNMTFKRKAKKRGLEPDECYCVGEMKKADAEIPDIAFEVVITSGGVDKLDAYRRLGVPEVWFWEDGAFAIHRLGPKGYERVERSAVLPGLDFAVLAELVASKKSQTEAVRAFRELLRKG